MTVLRVRWRYAGLAPGVLALEVALMGSLVFVRRITRPLAALVQATQAIDRGEPTTQVAVQGDDEIAALAASFLKAVT
jgi:nitrogen fixation/metabolism regulation signal transduction histidine kinase